MTPIRQIKWDVPEPNPNGTGFIRTYYPDFDDVFWTMWEKDKYWLKKQGVRVFKDEDDDWVVTLWTPTREFPGDEGPIKQVNLGPLPEIETKWDGGELMGPQVDHVRKLIRSLNKTRSAVDASQTGVGKTIISLMVAKNMGLTPFILCPKSVIPSWNIWMKRIGVQGEVINYEQATRGNWEYVKRNEDKQPRPAYKKFQWELPHSPIPLVIFDEAHRCKGKDTLQGLLLSSLKKVPAKCLMLSATLAENPMDMKNTGFMLDCHGFTNFYPWLKKTGCSKGRFGWQFNGDRGIIKLLHDNLFPYRGSRLSKNDMKAYFPENRILPLPLDVDGKIGHLYAAHRKQLDQIRRQLEQVRAACYAAEKKAELEGKEFDPAKFRMVEMLRRQQQAELLKVPLVADFVKDQIDEGNSVVIFCQFRETMEMYAQRLDCLQVHGSQTAEERQEAIEQFQGDKKFCLVCQIQAGGQGISLHQERAEMRPRISVLNPCYDSRMVKQALGRIERTVEAGREGYTTLQYIAYDKDNELERRICEKIEEKCLNMDTLNDGDFAEVLELTKD